MDKKDPFYRAAIKPTRIAIVLYAIVKQIFYTICVPGHGWINRVVVSVVLIGSIWLVTESKKLTRRQITSLVLLIAAFSEMIFYVSVGGDRLIIPFLIGCSLLSIMYGDLRASVAVMLIAGVAFAVCLFVFGINVVGKQYEYVDLIFDYVSVAILSFMTLLIGRYTIGTIERERRKTEAVARRVERDARTFRMFYRMSHEISSALSAETIFKAISDMMPQVVPYCERMTFLLHDPDKQCLRIEYIAGNERELKVGMEFPADSRGLYAMAFNDQSMENIHDYNAVKTFRFTPDERPSVFTRSLILIPLFSGGRCMGVFSAESSKANHFGPEYTQILATKIEIASVALARALLYLKMEKLATTDGLTGLNNHRAFQDAMATEFKRTKRYNRPMSLLLMDIDHFKSFNDTHGHPVGDMVLREVAASIRTTVRVTDFPARYGGEEFAVMMPETDEEGAYAMAERIRETVENRVVDSGGEKLKVTLSVGCVTFPTHGETQREIIDLADRALYQSKKGGRNRVSAYTRKFAIVDTLDRR